MIEMVGKNMLQVLHATLSIIPVHCGQFIGYINRGHSTLF